MRFAFALALFLGFSASAQAHIVASPNTAESGAWFRTDLRVSHGCDGSDTTKIIVTIPHDVLIIKPQVKPGWKIDIEKVTLKKPVQGPHGVITEVTHTISWTGLLPDAFFDEFGLTMKLPEKTGVLAFPTKQICVKGETDWKDTSDETEHHHGADFPAPTVTLTPATAK